MIIFATATAAGSLRSTNPSLRKAVSNAADIFLISKRVIASEEWSNGHVLLLMHMPRQ